MSKNTSAVLSAGVVDVVPSSENDDFIFIC
jgi:hypothetical protein